MIPFLVGYYRKSVHQWLGNRWRIIPILLIILFDLLVANEVMYMGIWLKVILTVLVATILFSFYRRERLNELM